MRIVAAILSGVGPARLDLGQAFSKLAQMPRSPLSFAAANPLYPGIGYSTSALASVRLVCPRFD